MKIPALTLAAALTMAAGLAPGAVAHADTVAPPVETTGQIVVMTFSRCVDAETRKDAEVAVERALDTTTDPRVGRFLHHQHEAIGGTRPA